MQWGGTRVVSFTILIYFTGSVFGNYMFKDLSDKNSSTSYLMVPASHFEKFLTGLFYAFVLFPIIFLIIFLLIDSLFVNYTNGIIAQIKGNTLPKNKDLLTALINEIKQGPALKIIAWYIFQSYVILGSLVFSRWSYIKTGFAAFVVFLVIFGLLSTLGNLFLFGLEKQMEGLYSTQVSDIRTAFGDSYWFITNYLVLPFLLIVSYLKLKEKQV
jgi:predicted MFS family arabinose efflux permease